MLHQTIAAAWMLDKELTYFKGGCLAGDMGLGKVSLGHLFLTASPADPSFCRPSRCMRVLILKCSVVDVSHNQDCRHGEASVNGSDLQLLSSHPRRCLINGR